jgi:signal transduction histidine kinase
VRSLGPALLVALLALAGVGYVAWHRAEADRTAGLREQALAMAEVLKAAALEATTALEAAEEHLAGRLAAAARRADRELAAARGIDPRGVLARLAYEERVGRIVQVDPAGGLVLLVRHPEPLPTGSGEVAALRERTEALEQEELVAAARALAPEAGEVKVEGLRTSRLTARERFGIAYGRREGGTLLLRADPGVLADLRRRFGVEPVLDRVRAQPGVRVAQLLHEPGVVVLGTAGFRDDLALRVPMPGNAWPTGAVTEEAPGTLRAVVPFALGQGPQVAVDLVVSTERADDAVARSRSTVLAGVGLGAAGLLGAGLFLSVRERRRRRAEAEERLRREDERRLAEMGALTALVTHELSNPLNAVRLGLALLRGEAPPEDRERVLGTVEQQVARMGQTLEGFLGVARGARPAHAPVGPSLLADVAERAAPEARQRGVLVEVHTAPDALPVPGDALVLEQALTNLLRNALRLSPPGGRVTLAWERAGDGGARLTVDDEGPGFPPEGREALLKVGAAGRPEGHGLGLPLAERFVRQHGGRLMLLDRPGGGARVEVLLPPAEASGAGHGGA